MSNLYNRLQELCKANGITGYRMAKDAGVATSLMTDLKMGRKKSISAEVADKLANYFGVSVSYLLGTETEKAPTQEGEREVSDDDIKFALFGGSQDISDAMFEEVKDFAEYVKQREKNKKK